MSRGICCAIQKGGTGKTSLSGNLARIIANKGVRVLLIDADPQGSLTSWVLTTTPAHELADVLMGKVTLPEAIVPIPQGGKDHLGLVPSFGIGGNLRVYAETAMVREPFICADLTAEAGRLGWDLILYDTHPGDTHLERGVILGCGETLMPVTLEYLSIDGIEIFKAFLREIEKGFRHRIKADKLVLSMVNRSFRRHGMYGERAQGLGYQVFEIAQDSKVPEAQIVHQFLSDYDPASKVIPELERLAGVLMEA
jgi:chromosome partitioning protein